MELLDNLMLGFSVAVTPTNLFYCALGVTLGTLIGVLPGIGAVATMGMLLPITFTLPPTSALIMLAGLYYGSQYGGSTTAILVNIPGTASSSVICLDGHPMAKQGRAGPALVITTLASFLGGSVAILLIAMLGPPLSEMALKFGSPEYFTLMTMALTAAAALAHGSLIKGIAMVVLGVLLGVVGTDVNSGMSRLTFGATSLSDGIHFVVIVIGLFGVGELLRNLEPESDKTRRKFTSRIPWRDLIPTRKDMRMSWKPALRGLTIGSFFGILPGTGASMASFSTYAIEKKIAKDPSRFGKGAIEGIAGPEAANNACAQTSFIPTLSLGIPGSAAMALMLGAMTIHGIQPGPQVMVSNPDLFWGLIASMWIGNLMLLMLNFPMVGIWVRLLAVPYRILFPAIVAFCGIGIYSLANNPFDLILVSGFGLVGYLFIKLKCEPAPLVLGFILGPLVEENLRRALLISRGDFSVFFTRPLSLTFIILTVILLCAVTLPDIIRAWRGRDSKGRV
ncbi:MAG: tripartite tricarboxylate transporter permease [Burkholderiales bacterium]|nr:tripartite tricarboxylate transporter permease [Burkholderiales bacterium]MDP2398121.1 tripartite tricarboxylate transporter permease [Burkholderiales bacterium]